MRATSLRFLASVSVLLLSGSVFAGPVKYAASLSGPAEAPPVASPGTGSALVTYDAVARTLEVDVTFSGLIGTVTASHIHGPTAAPGTGTAGVATPTPTFPGFPSGVKAGSYNGILDLTQVSSYRAGFVTANGGTAAGAEAALTGALANGTAYLNIHTTAFPGGEIRGFLNRVPDSGATALMLAGPLLAFIGLARRRRAHRG